MFRAFAIFAEVFPLPLAIGLFLMFRSKIARQFPFFVFIVLSLFGISFLFRLIAGPLAILALGDIEGISIRTLYLIIGASRIVAILALGIPLARWMVISFGAPNQSLNTAGFAGSDPTASGRAG